MRVWGSGLEVFGSSGGVRSLLGILGRLSLGFGVLGSWGFRVLGFWGFGVLGFLSGRVKRSRVLWFRVYSSDLLVQGLQGLGFRVYRVQGFASV